MKCSDCGFLCVRDGATHDLCEVDSYYRNNGWLDHSKLVGHRRWQPICFMRAFDLGAEVSEDAEEGSEMSALNRAVIHRERSCRKFCEWRQGFTPKEHAELLMFEEQHKWQKEQARWNFWATMGAAAIGFVAALLAVLVARWIQ